MVCVRVSVSVSVSVCVCVSVCVHQENLLILGLVVCVHEALAVEELGHDVGLEGHVKRRAGLLALKQVGMVAHLRTQTHTRPFSMDTHTHTHFA